MAPIIATGHVRLHPLGFAFLFVFAALSFALYFLPFIIAASRHHPQAALIFVIDFLLGWTGIGWVAVLVWSLVGSPADH